MTQTDREAYLPWNNSYIVFITQVQRTRQVTSLFNLLIKGGNLSLKGRYFAYLPILLNYFTFLIVVLGTAQVQRARHVTFLYMFVKGGNLSIKGR